MTYDHTSPNTARDILAARAADELEPLLADLIGRTGSLLTPEIRGWKLFMRDLDATVPHVAQTLGLHDVQADKSNENVCIIATQFYSVGGHTRVAADVSRIIGGDRVTVILTNLYGRSRYRDVPLQSLAFVGLEYRALLLLASSDVVDRTAELYCLLKAIKPTRIFLLSHFFDICAVTATYPFRQVTEFLHHADHLPSLGATLPYSRHVDLTYKAFRACEASGLAPVYAGLTAAPPRAAGPGQPLRPKTGLRFATCGHLQKYKHPARHSWAEWVAHCLREPLSDFVHMGPCDEAFVSEMRAALAQAGVDPARYAFLGPVQSLRTELLRHDVDVYLSSYPESGGLANLEALSARKPVIMPKDPNAPPLLHSPTPLPGFIGVQDLDQLDAAVRRALLAKSEMERPEFETQLAAELSRFEDYVRLRPTSPVHAAPLN